MCLAQAPYAISHVNPLLGGQRRARNNILLGWGEGNEVLGAEIAGRERGNCDDVKIHRSGYYYTLIALPCGVLTTGEPLGAYDYVIGDISSVQRRQGVTFYPAMERRGHLIEAVHIGGVPDAELWAIP